jgi:hypothetical protein
VLQFGPDLLRQHKRRLHVLLLGSGLLHRRQQALLRCCAHDVLQGRILQLNPDLLQRKVLRQKLAADLLRHVQ